MATSCQSLGNDVDGGAVRLGGRRTEADARRPSTSTPPVPTPTSVDPGVTAVTSLSRVVAAVSTQRPSTPVADGAPSRPHRGRLRRVDGGQVSVRRVRTMTGGPPA